MMCICYYYKAVPGWRVQRYSNAEFLFSVRVGVWVIYIHRCISCSC